MEVLDHVQNLIVVRVGVWHVRAIGTRQPGSSDRVTKSLLEFRLALAAGEVQTVHMITRLQNLRLSAHMGCTSVPKIPSTRGSGLL